MGNATFTGFMDMEKAFDWIKRPFLLYYLLLECNIDAKIYKAIKALKAYTANYIRNSYHASVGTDWYQVPSGVRQGNPLSLFNIFIKWFV